MDGSIVVAGLALVGTVATAVWKYLESKNTTDKVTGVEVSQSALVDTINTLRDEIKRYKEAAAEAFREAQDAREEAAQMLDQYESMRMALAATRTVVSEHEDTINKQQREITRLKQEIASIRGRS